MLKAFTLVDSFWIEQVFEPCAHWLQKFTTKPCYAFARQLITLGAVVFLVNTIMDILDDPFLEKVMFGLTSVIVQIVCIWFGYRYIYQGLEEMEKEWSLYAPKTGNPTRIVPMLIFLRPALWHLAVGSVLWELVAVAISNPWEMSRSIATFAAVSVTSGLYLGACTPLPPNRLKAGNPLASQTT